MEINYPIDTGIELFMTIGAYVIIFLKWIFSNIGTLGMFVLTLFYVVYTKRMMESSKETVKQGEINLNESRKPEVIAFFREEKGFIYF